MIRATDEQKGALARVIYQLDHKTPEELDDFPQGVRHSDVEALKDLAGDLGIEGWLKPSVENANVDDQTRAIREGWCMIENSSNWLEIQADDDGSDFPTDGLARAYVMEKTDEGSDYHRRFLIHITNENRERFQKQLGWHGDLPWIFLWKRTWEGESVVEQTVEKVEVDYDPCQGVIQPATRRLRIASNEDLVFLHESRAVPDLTYELSGFNCVPMRTTIVDHNPVGAMCGSCDHAFPIDPVTEENLKMVIIEGRRTNVSRCPKCGALGHQPKKR